MKRIAVNPWEWSKQYQFNQGEIFEGVSRQLVCAGQTSIDADGKVQHPDDLRGQITAAMNNLEAVLKGAGMGFENLTRITLYTTGVDEMIENWDAFAGPLARRERHAPQHADRRSPPSLPRAESGDPSRRRRLSFREPSAPQIRKTRGGVEIRPGSRQQKATRNTEKKCKISQAIFDTRSGLSCVSRALPSWRRFRSPSGSV